MRKEAQAIEIFRQAAILTVSTYGFDDPLGEHLMKLLTDTADMLASHFEVMYALRSYQKTIKGLKEGGAAVPTRRITGADAALARDVIMRMCRETLDAQTILDYIETADYISDRCVRMSTEQHSTA